MRIVLAVGCALVATASVGQVYKCVSPDGKVEYRGSPCEGSQKTAGNVPVTSHGYDPAAALELERIKSEYRRLQENEDAAHRARVSGVQREAAERERIETARKNRDFFFSEKQTVKTREGWDRKTRAEILADEIRKSGRKPRGDNCFVNVPRGSTAGTVTCYDD